MLDGPHGLHDEWRGGDEWAADEEEHLLDILRRAQNGELYEQPAHEHAPTLRGNQSKHNLGGSVELLALPGAPVPQSVCYAMGDDDSPTIISACLGWQYLTELDPAVDPVDPPEGVATIEWGVGGAWARAEVDYIMGTNLTLVASSVRVSADFRTTATILPTPRARASAMLVYGALPGVGVRPARRSINLGLIAGGGAASTISVIPAFATSVTLVTPDTAAYGDLRLDILSRPSPAASAILWSDFPAGASDENAIPIANRARFVRVSNMGPAAATVRLIYTLAMG